MIGLLLTGFVIAAQANSPASAKFRSSLLAYQQCVRTNAISFERAKESVSETVAAAFSACENQRAEYLFAVMDLQKSGGKQEPSIKEADESTKEMIDDALRSEMVVRIIRLRAGLR